MREEPGSPGGTTMLAKLLSEVFAPWVIVLLLPLAVAWEATGALGPTLLWGLLVAFTSSILPMAVIVWGARTQRWDSHHVRDREGRLIPFLVLIALSALGLGLLLLLGAPWPLVALDVCMIASLLVTGAITIRWKISMHAAVASGATVILVVIHGVLLWSLSLVVAAVCWSRVVSRDHTSAQVIAGTVAGALVGGGIYALIA
ncbi:hypothetical protein BAY61_14275 [Prauserella marina]|uniref:Uncharacterized protein n=1 Tax=Prauserella marina TaxID=530584 RepID=A0A222VQF6_9PSEU|nr:hypothetical protein [Prauserella marina]ASR35973.1 hypothetical protein BAY61_14275 [Prauserella marina]PWV84085.1 hypothetical protein DES30_101102 [Prauserella marina]SDC30681.1 hypothetical protein SAMN05421630_1011235 [Prauserella marina]